MATKIYLASENGLAVIAGSSGQWRGEMQLHDQRPRCVAAGSHPLAPVYCGTVDNGLFRNLGDGSGWLPCKGIRHRHVMAIAVRDSGDSKGGGIVYAGTEPSALFRSVDQGETWHELSSFLGLPSAPQWSFPPRPQTHHVRFIQFDPAIPSRLYMAIEAGALLRSDDAGETWRDRVPGGPYDTHTLAVHAKAPGRLYSAAGDGYFESLDGGDTWRRIEDGLQHRYCWNIAVDPSDPNVRVLTATSSAREAHTAKSAISFVYRRTGEGPWREVREGLSAPEGRRVPVATASVVEPGVFYLAAEGDLFRSGDGGASWQPVQVQWVGNLQPDRIMAIAVAETA